MVGIVQSVEHQIVDLGVVGSSPSTHPSNKTPKGVFFCIIKSPDSLTVHTGFISCTGAFFVSCLLKRFTFTYKKIPIKCNNAFNLCSLYCDKVINPFV